MAEEHLLSLLLAELNYKKQKNQKNHKQKKHELVRWWVVEMMVELWLKVACVEKVGKVVTVESELEWKVQRVLAFVEVAVIVGVDVEVVVKLLVGAAATKSAAAVMAVAVELVAAVTAVAVLAAVLVAAVVEFAAELLMVGLLWLPPPAPHHHHLSFFSSSPSPSTKLPFYSCKLAYAHDHQVGCMLCSLP